jgi:hypothetical protein
MDVYLRGKRIKLDPTRSLGKGGEADVFDLGGGRALKLFKSPDHPDYQGLPSEQRAAEERIALHQHKLRAFPAGLPRQVIAPEELATDRSGRSVVGYAMQAVALANPLVRYGEPTFRRVGVTNRDVVRLFLEIHAVVSGLHTAGVVIGDFNDLNVLVTSGAQPRFIDADSFQFGPYPCNVFTERFVDPLLCDARATTPRLARAYNPDADWYAFASLLMQSLLFVAPYGGVYLPKNLSRRIPNAARPLHRITVFHPEVRYPKPATRYEVLPDDLLQYLHRVFEKDERGSFPAELLDRLRFEACPRCAVEHARFSCPFCAPGASQQARAALTVRGPVVCTRVFETAGVVLHACVEQGAVRFLYHEAGAYRREDGSVVFRGDLDPSLRFAILGHSTLVGRGGELAVLSPGQGPERLSVDSDGAGPAFASNGRHRYWTAAGRLLRDAASTPGGASRASRASIDGIGDVLAGQTRIWAGPTFGLGLYRASNLSVAFTFDSERRGINDTLRLPPLRGQLVDAACVLDEGRAWLLLALHHAGKTSHLCLAYSRAGALEATTEATAGDGSWLGRLHGKCATQGMLLAATDAGIVRIELRDGALQKTREFPDTEPFVDAACQLLIGKDGVYVIGRSEITALKINPSRTGDRP